ncbi:MAG TPA: DUF554 domain-containing protein, partial [Chloroflexota bacterium]
LFQTIGLITIILGLQRALGTTNILILLVSVVVGGILGELLRIEDGLAQLANLAQSRLGGRQPTDEPSDTKDRKSSLVSQGFITASLIFCVGPITILGSIEDGLTGAYQTLVLKAALDGVTSIILASTFGWGVLLAAGTVFFFQGALTLSAGLLHGVLTDPMVTEMTAAGGLMILGLGLNILELARIRVGNLLPGLAVAPALVALTRS